jgi:hypothetical protein
MSTDKNAKPKPAPVRGVKALFELVFGSGSSPDFVVNVMMGAGGSLHEVVGRNVDRVVKAGKLSKRRGPVAKGDLFLYIAENVKGFEARGCSLGLQSDVPVAPGGQCVCSFTSPRGFFAERFRVPSELGGTFALVSFKVDGRELLGFSHPCIDCGGPGRRVVPEAIPGGASVVVTVENIGSEAAVFVGAIRGRF